MQWLNQNHPQFISSPQNLPWLMVDLTTVPYPKDHLIRNNLLQPQSSSWQGPQNQPVPIRLESITIDLFGKAIFTLKSTISCAMWRPRHTGLHTYVTWQYEHKQWKGYKFNVVEDRQLEHSNYRWKHGYQEKKQPDQNFNRLVRDATSDKTDRSREWLTLQNLVDAMPEEAELSEYELPVNEVSLVLLTGELTAQRRAELSRVIIVAPPPKPKQPWSAENSTYNFPTLRNLPWVQQLPDYGQWERWNHGEFSAHEYKTGNQAKAAYMIVPPSGMMLENMSGGNEVIEVLFWNSICIGDPDVDATRDNQPDAIPHVTLFQELAKFPRIVFVSAGYWFSSTWFQKVVSNLHASSVGRY